MAASSKALSNIGPKIWEAIMESPDDYWSQFQDLTKPTTIKETEHLHYEFQSVRELQLLAQITDSLMLYSSRLQTASAQKVTIWCCKQTPGRKYSRNTYGWQLILKQASSSRRQPLSLY